MFYKWCFFIVCLFFNFSLLAADSLSALDYFFNSSVCDDIENIKYCDVSSLMKDGYVDPTKKMKLLKLY
jgi:hypothetical protein